MGTAQGNRNWCCSDLFVNGVYVEFVVFVVALVLSSWIFGVFFWIDVPVVEVRPMCVYCELFLCIAPTDLVPPSFEVCDYASLAFLDSKIVVVTNDWQIDAKVVIDIVAS